MTATDYVFDGFFKTCDVCGNPRRADEITVRDNIVICDIHPGYRTARELDRINARRRLPIEKPIRNSKPFSPLPTDMAPEGAIFDLVTTVAPFETYNTTSDGNPGILGSTSYRAAGWAMIYLLAIVAEGRRPEAWRTRALQKAIELGDFLITKQVGNGTSPTLTSATAAHYGAFTESSGTYLTEDVGTCCAALCKLYQQTSTLKYLDAAKRCANFLANAQAGELMASAPTAKRFGAAALGFSTGTNTLDASYLPSTLVSAWGLSVLKGIAGDGTYGAPGTVGGIFTASPALTLTAAITQQTTFWSTGAAETGSTTVINGFSATTPRAFYDGVGQTWNYFGGTKIPTSWWTEGVYALLQIGGITAQVSSLFTYLAGLTADTTFATPDGSSDKVTQQGVTGDFDATLAPATTFDAGTGKNATAFYDWASTGLLAQLQASLAPAKLAAVKEMLSVPRHRTVEGSPRDGRTQYLGRLGRSGLSFQPFSATNQRRETVSMAAQTGLLYRYRQGFMGDE